MLTMFLGRSTTAWTALISAAIGFGGVIAVQLGADPGTVATVGGSLGAFLGVVIAFVAQTSTTPVSSPQLPAGTEVGVTNQAGTVTHTTTV